PAPVENPAENPIPVQNATPAKNSILMQNQVPAPIPEDDLISFNENSPTHQPIQLREANEEWFDLMEKLDDNEPSDSEYDTADEEPDVYFEKINDSYINRITETEKFNEGEKRLLALKGELKHETIEIIREDRIGTVIEKEYNEIIDQIEDEAIQESGWSFVRAEE
ncbi:8004_t:CDS:2, partial [Ambispora gerdemannii]